MVEPFCHSKKIQEKVKAKYLSVGEYVSVCWLARCYEGSDLTLEVEATAARASSGSRSGFVRMSVVVHRTRREFSTAERDET